MKRTTKRNVQVLGLCLAGAAYAAAPSPVKAGDAPAVPERRFEETGLVTVMVPARRADRAAVEARVAREFGEVRLDSVRRVRGRRGDRVAFVFELPRATGAKSADGKRTMRRLARMLGGPCDEVVRKPAKGKPVNLQVFESDTDAQRVRQQPALTQIGAVAAQARATGRGQVVAVLDGGFDLGHEFLAGSLTDARYDALDDDAYPQDLGNWINDDAALERPGEAYFDHVVGHGTFVSSLILSAAPGVKILPVRVLDDEGWGTDLSVASGITFAVEHGATVINMSLVLPDASPMVRDAIRAASAAGVVIVTASGTTDDGWQTDAFLIRHALVVGAIDRSAVIADWMIADAGVDVYAPGLGSKGAIGGPYSNSYGHWDGVSFAVPFLAAGAAMIREIHPTDWSAARIRDRLAETVTQVFDSPGGAVNASGGVDLARAVLLD